MASDAWTQVATRQNYNFYIKTKFKRDLRNKICKGTDRQRTIDIEFFLSSKSNEICRHAFAYGARIPRLKYE